MKIGIVSDSHGSTNAIDQMLAHPAAQGVTLWLHAETSRRMQSTWP